MRNRLTTLLFLLITIHFGGNFVRAETHSTQSASDWFRSHQSEFFELYQWLHTNPELSFEEERTAAKLAAVWRKNGFEVTEGIGGHGIVGILSNGEGTTVMLRTDLDALPVTEQTPLPFASQQTAQSDDGSITGIMHACGHDIHMTNLTAVATYLSQHRNRWNGTLMLVGQPAEEKGAGAKAMLDDGLFENFSKPDFALALHVSGDLRTGQVKILPGYALANVDSVDIKMKGRGGHGSKPHTTIDPIVQAAELVLSLQMIVSREIDPIEPAVVTVGSIHGGTKHNIIGNDCTLQLTVRSYKQSVRKKVLEAIRRRTLAVAMTHGAPEPDIIMSEGTPSLKNDAKLSERMRQVFSKSIGENNVIQAKPSMGGEDFSRYGIAGVPILMYGLGSVNQSRLERFKKLDIPPPSLHSGIYYPDAPETLETGFTTMVAGALDLLQ